MPNKTPTLLTAATAQTPAVVPPVVLVVAGLDPCGGAGLAADISSITALGAHPAPVCTTLTAQNTQGVFAVEAVTPSWLEQQLEAVLADSHISAIKIGLLPNPGLAETLRLVLNQLEYRPPVVLDPVLVAGSGDALNTAPMVDALLSLLPYSTVATPNARELSQLTGAKANAQSLLASHSACGSTSSSTSGLDWLLVTGGDQDTPQVENQLYAADGSVEHFQFTRHAGVFHGSGCTLSSTIAALLAHGQEPAAACRQAQHIVAEYLATAYAIGQGQLIPNRLAATALHSTP